MVLTALTDAVRASVAGRANKAVKSVAEPISFINSFAQNQAGGKFKTDVMSYPSDVDSDPQQGHYINFLIHEFTQGKIKTPKTDKSFNKIVDEIVAEEGGDEGEAFIDNQSIDKGPEKGIASTMDQKRSFHLQQPTRKIPAAISLYMPPSVSVVYNVGYADQSIGTLAMLGSDAIKAFTSGSSTATALSAVLKSLSTTGAEGLKNAALGAADMVAPGVKALTQLETGKVVTPKMELMFENVGRRDFSFKFDFIPKSATEAKTIQRIIHTFKINMMPEFVEGSQREMRTPNIFEITYMHQGKQNKYMNKISKCFLKNVEVTYGGDRFTAYGPIDGSPPPQKSSISLSFGEIEIMNKEKIREGY